MKLLLTVKIRTTGKLTNKAIRELIKALEKKPGIEKVTVPYIEKE